MKIIIFKVLKSRQQDFLSVKFEEQELRRARQYTPVKASSMKGNTTLLELSN